MRSVFVFLAAALLVCAVPLSDAHAGKGKKGKGKGKTKPGVFGTINGKAFKAPLLAGCIQGTYLPEYNILTVSALECKGKRRAKKNHKVMVFSCQRPRAIDPPFLTPPFELTCPASTYNQTKTGRFGVTTSMTIWSADWSYDAATHTTGSSLRARIDAFDGTTMSGVLYGSFPTPVSGPGSEKPAAINGEMRFSIPVTVE
jgi:hypothetical protein